MNEEKTVKEYLSQNGKKGGDTTKQRHGKEHYKRISKLALEARWGKKASVSTEQA